MSRPLVVSAIIIVFLLVILGTSGFFESSSSDVDDAVLVATTSAPAEKRAAAASSIRNDLPRNLHFSPSSSSSSSSIGTGTAGDAQKKKLQQSSNNSSKHDNDILDGTKFDGKSEKEGQRDNNRVDDFEHPFYHGNPNSVHCQLPTARLGRGTIKERARIALRAGAPVAENMKQLFEASFDEKNMRDGLVVPALITPAFRDGDLLRTLLHKFDAPVRHFIFICNSDDDKVADLMAEIQPLTMIGAATIFQYHGYNRGFSTSINLGYRRAREILFGKSEFAFLPAWPFPVWYFAVNCDAIFRARSAPVFARGVSLELNLSKAQRSSGHDRFGMSLQLPAGLFYGDVIDHYAFAITQEAIDVVGFFDEVYTPGYNEDIDLQYRVHNGGFRSVSYPAAPIGHHQSINLKRAGGQSLYKQQIHRASLGFEYGWMKWGIYNQEQTRLAFPPSGRKRPFLVGVPSASNNGSSYLIGGLPLHLWRVDPAHRKCIVTGEGVYFVKSSTCWYNFSVLLEWLPKGLKLPRYLRQPTVSLRDFLDHGRNNSRFE